MFLYVSAFFLFECVDWIEIRLSKLNIANKEVVEEENTLHSCSVLIMRLRSDKFRQ
jgi:hypothetical protein